MLGQLREDSTPDAPHLFLTAEINRQTGRRLNIQTLGRIRPCAKRSARLGRLSERLAPGMASKKYASANDSEILGRFPKRLAPQMVRTGWFNLGETEEGYGS